MFVPHAAALSTTMVVGSFFCCRPGHHSRCSSYSSIHAIKEPLPHACTAADNLISVFAAVEIVDPPDQGRTAMERWLLTQIGDRPLQRSLGGCSNFVLFANTSAPIWPCSSQLRHYLRPRPTLHLTLSSTHMCMHLGFTNDFLSTAAKSLLVDSGCHKRPSLERSDGKAEQNI